MVRKINLLLLFLFFINSSFSQSNLKDDIFSAIEDGSYFTINHMLDSARRSKCDYDIISGSWNPYEEAWHTGQAIYGLVEAYQVTRQKRLLDQANKSLDWWLSLQFTEDPFLKGMLNAAHGSKLGPLINFTTITDGTNGIFALYEVTKNPRILSTCEEVADWMIREMYIEEEGLFYNIVDPTQKKVLKTFNPHRPEDKNPKITEVARPNNEGYFFKDLYEYTGKEKYKEVFLNLSESLVRRQYDNGFWMDFEPNDLENRGGKIHPRFNIWNAESLIEAYKLTEDEKFLNAALKTARAMQKLQRKNGRIYYFNYLDGNYREGSVCGSAVSFSGILWLKIKQLTGTTEFDDSIELSLKWVLDNRFPTDHPDENVRGAFLETRSRVEENKSRLFVRDIATAFGLRFLSMYYRQM